MKEHEKMSSGGRPHGSVCRKKANVMRSEYDVSYLSFFAWPKTMPIALAMGPVVMTIYVKSFCVVMMNKTLSSYILCWS